MTLLALRLCIIEPHTYPTSSKCEPLQTSFNYVLKTYPLHKHAQDAFVQPPHFMPASVR